MGSTDSGIVFIQSDYRQIEMQVLGYPCGMGTNPHEVRGYGSLWFDPEFLFNGSLVFREDDIKTTPIALVMAVSIILHVLVAACGQAMSDDTSAELVRSPVAGYRCFVLKADGKAIGGNCVKEE